MNDCVHVQGYGHYVARLRLAQSLVTSLTGKIPRQAWAKQLKDNVAALAKDIHEKSKLVYSCAHSCSPSPHLFLASVIALAFDPIPSHWILILAGGRGESPAVRRTGECHE